MDCSTNEFAIVPVSICENPSSFYLTTPIRNLLDCSNDQLIPINEHSDNRDKENNSTEVRKQKPCSVVY